ncbi:MAG: hypothetical protein MZV63_23355 [Marinilabiliales bacterium]|nr:hypothetical protein [Marinilabiliales bacterium]
MALWVLDDISPLRALANDGQQAPRQQASQPLKYRRHGSLRTKNLPGVLLLRRCHVPW